MSLRFLLAPLALLLIGATAPSPEPARPPLWKLSDADTTIYLFGTVHALPRGLQWKTGHVASAFAASDTLVVEVVEPDDMASMAGAMMAMGKAAPGSLPPLMERVPADKRAALKALLDKSPLPPQLLDGCKTWFAALVLAAPSIAQAGLDPESGADRRLMSDARQRHMRMIGLETIDEQLGYFNGLAEDDQRALLVSMVDDTADSGVEFAALIHAWSSGDIRGIEKLADDELKASPHIRDLLLKSRNRHWADWLARRMKAPGTLFMAVGAGHLSGADSVQAMLRAQGYRIDRVQ